MAHCFSGINCEALSCGSCNVSNDAALNKFPAGVRLSVRTTADYLELGVQRVDTPPVGEVKEIIVRGGIMHTTIQRS